MALIIDPDNLNQGNINNVTDAAWTASAGAVTTITGAATLPAIAAGEYFAIRNHSNPVNNGLYLETGGSPTTSSITATKQTGANPVDEAAEAVDFYGTTGAASELSVHFDIGARQIWLVDQGNLSTDGVTLQALYSFIKEEWRADADLIPHPFPCIAITREQFEFGTDGTQNNGWTFANTTTRKRIRTGGWREVENDGDLLSEQISVISLGSFEDAANDLAYYWQGTDATDTGAATDFTFAGPLNEAIEVYRLVTPADTGTGFAITTNNTITRNDGGDWSTEGYRVGGQITILDAEDPANNGDHTLTSVGAGANGAVVVSGTPLTNNAADTTMRAARNFRQSLKLFLRVRDADPNGKTYGSADLASIGVTTLENQAYRFPLANATDLKIAETDANIAANTPYTEIQVRYLDQAYNREVDTTTKRDFGIVVDVGTYSRANGVSNATTLFTSANFTDGTVGDYTGGSLIIHEGTDQGTHTISGTPVDNAGTLEVTLTAALTASETALSFTLQRATPVVATTQEIYEKIQYFLRQASDVDSTENVVTGKTADELLTFVGDSLKAGSATSTLPDNPNGGGSGVFIEGFDANDTNSLSFFDNTGTERSFPFVAAGNLNFNSNAVNDTGPAVYRMFFTYTIRTNVSDTVIANQTGRDADFTSAGSNLPTSLVDDEYFLVSGFNNEENNGVWRVNDASPTAAAVTATKIFPAIDPVNEAGGIATVLDENAFGTDGALLVDDNSGTDISGNVTGATIAFDFDYDGNTQGGRTAATDAAITIVCVGTDTAVYTPVTGTITRATGLSFTITAPLERNFNNP